MLKIYLPEPICVMADQMVQSSNVVEVITTEEGTSNTVPPSNDWQVGCYLNDSLLNVYDNSRWTDMVIRCGDKELTIPLKAHKVILAARSPVFEAMFFGPSAEQKNEYDFPDADVDLFDMMLRFMYHDDVQLNEVDEAVSLMEMGDLYKITKLVDHCALFLANNITVNNVCQSLDCGITYNVKQLREACCTFIDRNAAEVLQAEEFLSVSLDGLAYILKGDTLFADEDLIFSRVEDWAKEQLSKLGKEVNGKNIRDVLGKAFYHNRLSTLDTEKLMKCIKGKGYFTFEEYEDIVDCSSGRMDELGFLSNIRRIPIDDSVTIKVPQATKKDTTAIYQTLQIDIKKDVRLKSISIPFFQPNVKMKNTRQQLYTHDGTNYKTAPDKSAVNIDLMLPVKVTIDKINFKETFNAYQIQNNRQPYKRIFDKPVVLRKLDSPYTLTVNIQLINKMINNMYGNGGVSTMFGTVLDCNYLSGNHQHSSASNVLAVQLVKQTYESMIGVHEIGFENYSFRENEDE